jgi:hypothetical protein
MMLGLVTIALFYLMKGDAAEATKVLQEGLGNCEDNVGRTMVQSMLVGSLAKVLGTGAAATPVVSGTAEAPMTGTAPAKPGN